MPFAAIDSILSPHALLTEVTAAYDLGGPIACIFLNHGLNDHYEAHTARGRYVLRVYHLHWRTMEDILYELDVLLHLDRAGAAVARPIARKAGRLVWTLAAPEGERYAVLFTYAEGEHGLHTDQRSILYGRVAGQIHNASEGFASDHRRFSIDLEYLIDRPLLSVQPFLARRPAEWRDLQTLGALLKEHIAGLAAQGLETGVCHGDFHGGNCHIKDGLLTFFDFDFCGPGWRAYDVAVFWWSVARNKRPETLWSSYLQGYAAVRPLRDLERKALPLFVAARQIWYLGSQAGIASYFGSAQLDDRFFTLNIDFLRDWVSARIKET